MRKRIAALNFIDSFIGAALSIVVPLLMLDRKIDLGTIGVVSSVLPLVFTTLRVLFASVADQAGLKIFFLVDCLASCLASVAYFFSTTSTQFFFGKMAEGVRNASFWAVNRTAIFDGIGIADRQREASFMSGLRTFSIAGGTALAGIGISYFSFPPVLATLAFLSLIMAFPLFRMRDIASHRPDVTTTLRNLDFRYKHPLIWKASTTLIFYGIAYTLLFGFLMPIFLRTQLKLDYGMIGFLFAVFYLVDAFATFFALKLNISFPKLALLQTFLFCLGALLLPYATSMPQVLLLLVLLAVGDGFSAVFFESVIAEATKGSPSISTDIGFIHLPFHVTIFLVLFSAGFLAETFGYALAFWTGALAFAICSLLSLSFVKHERPQAILFGWLLTKRRV